MNQALSGFDAAAILIVLSAILGWINQRLLRLPGTVALTMMGAIASVIMVLIDHALPGSDLSGTVSRFLNGVDFHATLMDGMLSFLLFAGALHVDIDQLRKGRRQVAILATLGVITSTALQYMNQMMRQVITSGTGTKARVAGFDIAGKTGTTSDYRDAWFVGYTGGFVTAVWVGRDDNTPMRRVTGGGAPAAIWRQFMAAALPRLDVQRIPDGPAMPEGWQEGLQAPGQDPIGDILDGIGGLFGGEGTAAQPQPQPEPVPVQEPARPQPQQPQPQPRPAPATPPPGTPSPQPSEQRDEGREPIYF